MKTYLDVTDFSYSDESYDYQDKLTLKLDTTQNQRADQELINEIVLWKINRYVKMEQETLDLLNSPKLKSNDLDESFTKEILSKLLNTKGIRLPMASTILRFRNPNVYQILDQRDYRFTGMGELKLPTKVDEQINLYLKFLKKLKEISIEKGFNFSKGDRIFYKMDKDENSKEKIKY